MFLFLPSICIALMKCLFWSIPAGLVERAAGLAIITVAKVGFLVTARGGSGIVIARLNDGSK